MRSSEQKHPLVDQTSSDSGIVFTSFPCIAVVLLLELPAGNVVLCLFSGSYSRRVPIVGGPKSGVSSHSVCTSTGLTRAIMCIGSEQRTSPISNVAISKWSQFLFLYFVGDLKALKNSIIRKWRRFLYRKTKLSVRLYGCDIQRTQILFHSRTARAQE